MSFSLILKFINDFQKMFSFTKTSSKKVELKKHQKKKNNADVAF